MIIQKILHKIETTYPSLLFVVFIETFSRSSELRFDRLPSDAASEKLFVESQPLKPEYFSLFISRFDLNKKMD